MYQYKAKLVRVVDGDTVILDIDLGFHVRMTKRVRLARIDAIERHDDPTKAATIEVQDWFVETKGECFVNTILDKEDLYGRVIGEVSATFLSKTVQQVNFNLSDHQVEKGHAVYKDYPGGIKAK